MNKFEIGSRIVVVQDGLRDREPSDDNLIGWTGVVTKVWPDGALRVDLDPDRDPECDLTALHFEAYEVELEAV